MEGEHSAEIENTNKCATILCVQYLLTNHMNNKSPIKRDDLMKTVFKGRVTGKNFENVMNDVDNALKNVFGFSISFINNDNKKLFKQFIIVNTIEEFNIPDVHYSIPEFSKYRILLKPILGALVMLRLPISEGQMWNILEQFSMKFDLDMNHIKAMVKGDFVKEQYLEYKATDDTTIKFDPERTSYWFTLGPRALAECNQLMVLNRVAELYNTPVQSFKRVFAELHKNVKF